MGTWGLIQLVFNIFLGLGLFIVAMRITRQPKDDPRLSRGLQLLQAKIAVLEDLSDRTEHQVNQMTSLLEQKGREIQAKIELADKHVQLVRTAMDSSLEVAKIFQDKIPHQEVIERQNTLKYLQAARLAHQGKSVEEIAQAVDLPKGEIEFIAKVNREQLMFSEDQLPAWARLSEAELAAAVAPAAAAATAAAREAGEDSRRRAAAETARLSKLANQQELVENLQQVQREMNEMLHGDDIRRDFSDTFNVIQPPTQSLQRLGEEFRKACSETEEAQSLGFMADGLSFVELKPETGAIGVGSDSSETNETEGPLLELAPETIEAIKRSIAKQALTPAKAAPAPSTVSTSAAGLLTAAGFNQTASPSGSLAGSPAQSAQMSAKQAALAKARAAALELRNPQPKATVQAAPQVKTQSLAAIQEAPRVVSRRGTFNVGEPEVRKVEFPRIKSPKSVP